MPRRLFAVDYLGAAVARQWHGLTMVSAAGVNIAFANPRRTTPRGGAAPERSPG